MPELPEVEITRKTLQKYVKNEYISDIKINNYNLRYKIEKNLAKKLKKKKIIKITRRSKYLIFHLSDKNFLILHLGMSGRILVNNKKNNLLDTSFYANTTPLTKHNHIYFFFKKHVVIYNDTRRFGFIKYYLTKQFASCSHLKHLGIEQKFICGLGNIYVNEALFLSKIHPRRNCKTLTDVEIETLLHSIKFILKKAILLGGSTIRDFHNSEGKSGKFQNNFKVYDRENKKCLIKKCKGSIIKIVIAGRSSFFCNNCQKE
jgi:formamidopyrimidine-DNA glycosylase